MSIKTEFDEIEEIVRRTLAGLLAFSGMSYGRQGAELRYLCGDLSARSAIYIANGTFATRLLACFKLATTCGITLDWMDRVLKQLAAEQPTTLTSTSVVQNSLIFGLAQEARIIRATTYTSRDDVDALMKRMTAWFETIKHIIADTMSGPAYQDFINLCAAITRYLADVVRPLPRMLQYQMPMNMPGLAISNYIYGEGDRDMELAAETKVVHPAFFPLTIRALSA